MGGQKPVHKRGSLESREAVWGIIRRMKTFTVPDLHKETLLGIDTIRDYVAGLHKAGYIAIHGESVPGRKTSLMYSLVRDVGVDAPRVRKDGSEITQGQNRESMWRSMRILREFSVIDIISTASTDKGAIPLKDAKSYIHHLHKAGYLVMTSEGRPGNRHLLGRPARYRLLRAKNTGPKPPMVQRGKQVFDQNLRTVVWSGEGTNDQA
jgi:hypothetical protein